MTLIDGYRLIIKDLQKLSQYARYKAATTGDNSEKNHIAVIIAGYERLLSHLV